MGGDMRRPFGRVASGDELVRRGVTTRNGTYDIRWRVVRREGLTVLLERVDDNSKAEPPGQRVRWGTHYVEVDMPRAGYEIARAL